MKRYLSLTQIISILCILFIAICFAGFIIFSDIKNKNQSASEMQSKFLLNSKQGEYLISLQKLLENNFENITKINSSVIAKDSDLDFIENIENIAKENNLEITIDSLSNDDTVLVKNNSFTTLYFKAKTRGSWIGTYAFLQELETLPYTIKIKNFSLANFSDNPVGTGKTVANSSWQSSFEINVLKNK